MVNQNGFGIDNVSVQILNSNYSTQTDKSGNFTFQNIKERGTYVVRFNSIGYASENITIQLDKAVKIELQLAKVSGRLDDAIVTAYKEESDPQKIPASISILDEKDIKDHYLNNTVDQKHIALLNANISYETSGYSVTFWGQNLGNTTYLDYSYNFRAVHFGNPLTYGMTLSKAFGR